MLDPELKRLLQILKWESKKKFISSRRGLLFSAERGRGLDFKEVRNYQYGDDIRYIDWNVTSRTGELHTKEYYEEKDATIIIFLDLSLSMEGKKATTSFQLALFLALFHIKSGNRIFIVSFSDRNVSSNKWLKTETDVFTYFESLLSFSPGKYTHYADAYQYMFKIHPKYAIAYWLSDFNHLASWRETSSLPKVWDEYAIWISDPVDEIQFPLWLKCFLTVSQETTEIRKSNLTYKKDLSAVKQHFGNKYIKIDPNQKLRNQILPMFQTKYHG